MAAMLGMSLGSNGHSHAQTAGDVLTKMESGESASYIAGVIEGLAFARWIKDKPDGTGMKCIYDWKYGEGALDNTKKLQAWLRRNPDQRVGHLAYTLIIQDCGE